MVCHSVALLDPALISLSSFLPRVGKNRSSTLYCFSVPFWKLASLFPTPGQPFFCTNYTCQNRTFSSFMLNTSFKAISIPGRQMSCIPLNFHVHFLLPTALRIFLLYIYIYTNTHPKTLYK